MILKIREMIIAMQYKPPVKENKNIFVLAKIETIARARLKIKSIEYLIKSTLVLFLAKETRANKATATKMNRSHRLILPVLLRHPGPPTATSFPLPGHTRSRR